MFDKALVRGKQNTYSSLKGLCPHRCPPPVYVLWNMSVLYEAYMIRSKSRCSSGLLKTKSLLKVEDVAGEWTIWKRRSNLEGAHLTVGYVNERPYCFEVPQDRHFLLDHYAIDVDGKKMAGITIQVSCYQKLYIFHYTITELF